MDQFARFISWFFQPLFMHVYAAFIFIGMPYYAFEIMPPGLKIYLILSNALFTAIIPAIIILLMRRLKIIDSIYLSDKKERTFPIVMTFIFQGVNLYYLLDLYPRIPGVFFAFLAGAMVSLFIALVINFRWKISLHMIGIGGVCGSILFCGFLWRIDMSLILALAFIIAGMIGTSRLKLNAHNPAQIGIGFLAGFIPQVFLLLLR